MESRRWPRPGHVPPVADQLEINVFGPGVGECVLVHLGAGDWLMVDSCHGKGRKRPAALEYLDDIGASASKIKIIVATHWHDDHVRGISKVYEEARAAAFYVADLFRPDEFKAMTAPWGASKFTSGVGELARVAQEAQARSDLVRTVGPAQRLLHRPSQPVKEIWALSPSQEDMHISRIRIASLLPQASPGERRIPAQSSNDASVVLHLETDMGPVLLGGDLEHRDDRRRGWFAVLDLEGAPKGRASCFKVPHHGSVNAHCAEVWESRLEQAPVALVTPFDRGRSSLPRQEDRQRIRALTNRGYLTSDKRDGVQSLDRTTTRTIREVTREFAPINLMMGHVQLRAAGQDWVVAASEEVVPI